MMSYSEQEVFQLQQAILIVLRQLGGSGTSEELKREIGPQASSNAKLWQAARNGLLEADLIMQETPYSRMYLPEVFSSSS